MQCRKVQVIFVFFMIMSAFFIIIFQESYLRLNQNMSTTKILNDGYLAKGMINYLKAEMEGSRKEQVVGNPRVFLHIYTHDSNPALTDQDLKLLNQLSYCQVLLSRSESFEKIDTKIGQIKVRTLCNDYGEIMVQLADCKHLPKNLKQIQFPVFNIGYQILHVKENTIMLLLSTSALKNEEDFINQFLQRVGNMNLMSENEETVPLQIRIKSNASDSNLKDKLLRYLSSDQLKKIFKGKMVEFSSLKKDSLVSNSRVLLFHIRKKTKEEQENEQNTRQLMTRIKEIYDIEGSKTFCLCLEIKKQKISEKMLTDPFLTFSPYCQDIIVKTQEGDQRTFENMKTPELSKFVSQEIAKDGFEQIKILLPQECNKEQNLEDLKVFLRGLPLKSKKVHIELSRSEDFRIKQEFEMQLRKINQSQRCQMLATFPLALHPEVENDLAFSYLRNKVQVNLSQLFGQNLSYEEFKNRFNLTDDEIFAYLDIWDVQNGNPFGDQNEVGPQTIIFKSTR